LATPAELEALRLELRGERIRRQELSARGTEMTTELLRLINESATPSVRAAVPAANPKAMAVTGGSDWEPLAEPLKDIGFLYYCFFLFFIHESFLGEKLGVDLTIMAELTWSRQTQYDWRLAPQYSSSYEGDLGSPLASAQYLKSEASSATTLTKSQSPPLAAASSHSIDSYQAERPPGLPPHLTYGYGQPHPSFVVKQQQNFAQLPQSIP